MVAAMAAFRTLWTALVSFYEETFVLVTGNLASLALNLPIGLALFVIALPFVGSEEASTLWLYGTLFWLSLHIYLVPLLVHVAEPRLFDLYRRSAFIALGHPGYTIMLLVALLTVCLLTVVFLPMYVLVGIAFLSLVQA